MTGGRVKNCPQCLQWPTDPLNQWPPPIETLNQWPPPTESADKVYFLFFQISQNQLTKFILFFPNFQNPQANCPQACMHTTHTHIAWRSLNLKWSYVLRFYTTSISLKWLSSSNSFDLATIICCFFHTKFWHQSWNVSRKSCQKGSSYEKFVLKRLMKLTLGVKYFLALEAFEPQNGILTSLKNIHTYAKF